ncbi:MAG TPA: nuclear transport factor 2 family protein [Acidobacteriota bacterium]|nr:nuclear transport factor 2 family protein [Acidobacteriota bacterium]
MKLRLLSALGIALGAFGLASGSGTTTVRDQDIAKLVQLSAEANSALIQGDIDGYLARIVHAQDYTLMAPFGGQPTVGFDASTEHRAAMGRFFKSGNLKQEVVATYYSGDLAVLVTIEHVRAEVGELPEQDWSLRVTQVFRREGSEWRLAHRHADPLVNSLSLEQAAALARGDKS